VGSVTVDGAAARIGFRDDSTLEIGEANEGGRGALWAFEPDYRLVATLGTGGDDSPLPDRVNALAFRHDGLRLASGSGEPTRGGEVRVWDPATGRHLYALTNLHSDAVLALAWSADGSRLASGGADRFARVVDVSDGRVIANLEGHTGHVLGVSWRADGRVLATGGADGSVKFWTLGSADRARTVGGFAKEVVALAHVGTGGDVVAVPGETDLVRVTEAGEKPGTLPGAKDFHHAAAVTLDGRWLLAAGQEGVVRVWDVETRKLVREMGR
jgi:WD40 repeat protein